jgi:hypothetical protein
LENNLKVFKSDKFDATNATDLSLFLYPSSIHIFVKDKNRVNIAQYHEANFDWNRLESLFRLDPILNSQLPAHIFLHQNVFCLVPDDVFSKGNESTYLSYVGNEEKSDTFFSTSLDKGSVHLVSSISSELKSVFENNFQVIGFHHGAASFLSYIIKERLYQIGQEILISVFGNHGYFAVSVYQDLTSFSRFEINSKEDILKYTLVLISQLKLDTKLVRLSIFADKKEEFQEEYFEQYFHHIRILKPFGNQKYELGFEQAEPSNLFEASWQLI